MASIDFQDNIREQGGGRVERLQEGVRLLRPTGSERAYSNAEIGDTLEQLYRNPPLRFTLRAQFSHPAGQLAGTAGFGFWNSFLTPGGGQLRPPRAAWFFFGSPPNNQKLALGVPGYGFKAAVIDAQHAAFFALLPAAPLGVFLMRVPSLYRWLWPIAQRAIGVDEVGLANLDLTVPHRYSVFWEPRRVTFTVDDRVVLTTSASPGGPLRFVAWLDNSYAIVTPQGQLGFGLVNAPEAQWLDVTELTID